MIGAPVSFNATLDRDRVGCNSARGPGPSSVGHVLGHTARRTARRETQRLDRGLDRAGASLGRAGRREDAASGAGSAGMDRRRAGAEEPGGEPSRSNAPVKLQALY